MITSLDRYYRPLRRGAAPFYGLVGMAHGVKTQQLDLEPDFQRGHVWTVEQQCLFVGHVLSGGDVSPLLVNLGDRDQFFEHPQVVDGKQRLTACLRWEAGDIPATMADGEQVRLWDLDQRWRNRCSNSIGLEFARVRLSRREVLELYVRLNRAGTPHTDEEIALVLGLLEAERSMTSREGNSR